MHICWRGMGVNGLAVGYSFLEVQQLLFRFKVAVLCPSLSMQFQKTLSTFLAKNSTAALSAVHFTNAHLCDSIVCFVSKNCTNATRHSFHASRRCSLKYKKTELCKICNVALCFESWGLKCHYFRATIFKSSAKWVCSDGQGSRRKDTFDSPKKKMWCLLWLWISGVPLC